MNEFLILKIREKKMDSPPIKAHSYLQRVGVQEVPESERHFN